MINKVTITGADDSVKPEDLAQLSKEFPFVEWGILFSPNRVGKERYPSNNWLMGLRKIALNADLNLSAHICGEYSRKIFSGINPEIVDINKGCPPFQRVQLNYNSTKNGFDLHSLFADIIDKAPSYIQFIFQHNKANATMNSIIMNYKAVHNIAFLYDSSGGRGLEPTAWLPPVERYYTGYSGGLSPENLDENIQKITGVTGLTDVWVDMETGVRSDDGKSFDLAKVRKCLEIASKYILK